MPSGFTRPGIAVGDNLPDAPMLPSPGPNVLERGSSLGHFLFYFLHVFPLGAADHPELMHRYFHIKFI